MKEKLITILNYLSAIGSIYLVVAALFGLVQSTMPLAQILVYLLLGGLNLALLIYQQKLNL
jgi:hypothetical protein